MLITNHLKMKVWKALQKQFKGEGLSCGSDQFSILSMKMDSYNGATFWVIVDGEEKIRQVRTKFK